MKAVYLRGVTSGVRVMGAFINAISHRLSVRVSESHDDLHYERTVRNGAETISFCARLGKPVATLPRKINVVEAEFSAPLIFLAHLLIFRTRQSFSTEFKILTLSWRAIVFLIPISFCIFLSTFFYSNTRIVIRLDHILCDIRLQLKVTLFLQNLS